MHQPTRNLPFLSLVIAVATISSAAADWPQFRGPNATGIAPGATSLPVAFSADDALWNIEVGDGVGSPVVADNRVFIVHMAGPAQVALTAYAADTGKQLWSRRWEAGPLPEIHKTNSHASTTPAVDQDHVYFYFSTLGMRALDVRTGKDVWHLEMPAPFFVFKWGPAMSPVLYKDLVLFVQDDDLYPALYAIDRRTGEVRWRDDRSDMAVNYSHPVVCETPEGDEIVVAGTGKLIGYDPRTGKRRWHAKVLLRNIKTTPVVEGGTIYVSLQSGGIANQWLATADQAETGNSDGRLTKAEMQAFVGPHTRIPDAFYRKTFDRGDANKDGFLEGAELDRAFLHPDNFAGARFDSEEPADEYVLAVRGGGRGDVTQTHLLWKHPTRHTDHIVSPLVKDGRMLLVKGGGIATVFETSSGKAVGRPRRINNTSEYFASPVYGDGKIYVAGENGYLVVLENPSYRVLAKNDMGDSIVGTPAIAGNRIFVRTRSRLIAVGHRDAAP